MAATCPSRALANLGVLEATGSLPKTVSSLHNTLKPFSSQLIVVSPTLVLKSLPASVGVSSDGKQGQPPVHPGTSGNLGDRTPAAAGYELPYLHSETVKAEKLTDIVKKQALAKARKRNAVLVEVRSGDEMGPTLKQVRSLKGQGFTTQTELETYLLRKLISDVVIVDPNEVVMKLRELNLISSSPSGGVTYSPSLFKLLNPMDDQMEVSSSERTPSTNPLMEVETSSGNASIMGYYEQRFSVEEDPVLLASVKCIQKWGGSLPTTEQKLAKALEPTCKVVQFCNPTEVLKKLGQRFVNSKLTVRQEKRLELSCTGLSKGQHPPKQKRLPEYLAKFEKHLLAQARKSNSSVEYVTDPEKHGTFVESTVRRVLDWVTQRCKAVETSPTSGGANGVEPMALGPETHSGSIASLPRSQLLLTKASLISELFSLCVLPVHIEPEEMVRTLEALAFIEIGENGGVMYLNIPRGVPDREVIIKQLIKQEQATIQREVGEGGQATELTPKQRKQVKQERNVPVNVPLINCTWTVVCAIVLACIGVLYMYTCM